MKTIEDLYHEVVERNPSWSSCACFIEAIRGRRLKPRAVHRDFKKLVDKEDYSGVGLDGLFAFLDTLIIVPKK